MRRLKCCLQYECVRLKKSGICCATCPISDSCTDACENHPDRCMMSREPTYRELAVDNGIKSVKHMTAFKKIEETGEPVGLFYNTNKDGSRALDNRTGTPVRSEEFGTPEESVQWLIARVAADRKG